MNNSTSQQISNHPEVENKRNHKKQIISLLLAFALVITGLFAFLTATDTKTNVFTIGNVAIDLIEDFDVDQDGQLESNEHYVDEQPPTVENILPGQTILKQPYIENTGSNEAWVYAVVKVPEVAAADLTGNNGSVNAGTSTNPLNVVVTGYAIQDNYGGSTNDTSAEVWAAYAPDLDGDATEESSPNPQVFALNDVGTGWSLINTYHSTDGNVYYTYAYADKLPAADDESTANVVEDRTTPVFLSITLAGDIGGQTPVGIAYYVPNTNSGSSGTGEGEANLSILIPPAPAGYRLAHFEPIQQGQDVSNLYWDDSLAVEGKSFKGWTNEDEEDVLKLENVQENVSLFAKYENLATTFNTTVPDPASYLVYSYIEGYEEVTVVGANSTLASYPDEPTTVNIPSEITVANNNGTFETNDGSILNWVDSTLVSGTSKTYTVKKLILSGSSTQSMPRLDVAFNEIAKYIIIPDSITDIQYLGGAGTYSFGPNNSQPNYVLEGFNIPYSCETLRGVCDAPNLSSIVLTNGLKTLSGWGLANTGVREIEIPESVTSVDSYKALASTQLTRIIWKSNAELSLFNGTYSNLQYLYCNAENFSANGARITGSATIYLTKNVKTVSWLESPYIGSNVTIQYEGTQEEFQQITRSASVLSSGATIQYNVTNPY